MTGNHQKSQEICDLARWAIRSLFEKSSQEETAPMSDSSWLNRRGGVFVCLKKKGKLRGCIGTITPRHSSLREEIIHNAIAAAAEDPRFPPLDRQELSEVAISVDILSEAEPVSDLTSLDPRRYGVVVEWRGQRGVLLPNLEGIDRVEQQLDIAREKAGIPRGVSWSVSRFTADRYQEQSADTEG